MKNLSQSIRDIFFSSKCSLCGKNYSEKRPYLCYHCYNKISAKVNLNKKGNLYYITYYDRDIKKLLTSFKLRRRRYLGEIIGSLIKEKLLTVIEQEEIEVVVPVPVSKARRRERGYNQVEDILEYAGIGYERLKRVKNTMPMHSLLDEKLRKENVLGSFESGLSVKGRNILIVDDIVTTGSTIKEVIASLEKNGRSKKIVVFTFALANTALASDLSF